MFYTSFPKIPFIEPKFKNIAQFAPLLGFFIGVIQSCIYVFLRNNSWPVYACGPICLASGYLITGGLHIDGLMDTFDGIYAEKKRRLKAMKDSRVGSFGVQSLFLVSLIQLACLYKIESQIILVLPLCLFLGRFSTLIFIDKFKYISYKSKSLSHKKYWKGLRTESTISLIFLSIFIIYQIFSFTSNQSLFKYLGILLIGLFISFKIPITLGNKIGGFNGDSCGASVILVETTMIFIYAILL